jgi:hypothetical protein
LRLNLSRLIVYAENADVKLQREVAEKLANEVQTEEDNAIINFQFKPFEIFI